MEVGCGLQLSVVIVHRASANKKLSVNNEEAVASL